MKHINTIFSLLAGATVLCAATACNNTSKETAGETAGTETAEVTLPTGSIVYFDLERVLEEYDMANELRSEVETKVSAIQKDITRRQTNLENAVKDFNNKINKGLITSAVAADTQKKLQQQEASFQEFAQQKQNEIMEEQQVMMNRIMDALHTYLEEYNEEKAYAMIISNQAGIPVMVADASLNITSDIIAGLNAEYVKAKNNKTE